MDRPTRVGGFTHDGILHRQRRDFDERLLPVRLDLGQEEGTVIIELFEQWAPITTNNMIAHVESGLYDSVFFHRVINDFVTQSGDDVQTIGLPSTSPTCGSGERGETIPLEHNENLSHVDGATGWRAVPTPIPDSNGTSLKPKRTPGPRKS